jgi:hypothetical protein
MEYALIDHATGNTVASFPTQGRALAFVLDNIGSNRWGLFAFADDPGDDRLIAANGELRALARAGSWVSAAAAGVVASRHIETASRTRVRLTVETSIRPTRTVAASI